MAQKYYVDIVDGVEIYRKSRRFVKKEVLDKRGVSNGFAPLDGNGKVPSQHLPSYVDDTIEGYKNIADAEAFSTSDAYAKGDVVKYDSKVWRFITAHSAGAWNSSHVEEIPQFPSEGETGKIYVDLLTGKTYRWSGSIYVEISESLALGETHSTAYYGDLGAAAYAHGVTHKGDEFYGGTAQDKTVGFFKFKTNSEGHVTAASAVTKGDLTGLGVEDASNKLSAWQGTPDNDHYPAEKLVKDSIDDAEAKASAKIVLGAGSSSDADASSETSDPYINLIQGKTDALAVKSHTQIKGGTNVTVKGVNGIVTISSTDTDTHLSSKNVVGTSNSATGNGAVSGDGGVYMNHIEEDTSNNKTVTSSHKIVGDGTMVKVTSDSNGNITIGGKTATKPEMSGAIDAFDSAYDAAYATAYATAIAGGASESAADAAGDTAGQAAGWAAVDTFIGTLPLAS